MGPGEPERSGEVGEFGGGGNLHVGWFVRRAGGELRERGALGLGGEFSRRHLENVPLEVEGPHQGDIGLGEAAAVSGGEVIGEPLPEPFAVGGPDLAALLELDDAAADFPVSGGEDGVDGLGRGVASSAEQLGDAGQDLVVAGRFTGGSR